MSLMHLLKEKITSFGLKKTLKISLLFNSGDVLKNFFLTCLLSLWPFFLQSCFLPSFFFLMSFFLMSYSPSLGHKPSLSSNPFPVLFLLPFCFFSVPHSFISLLFPSFLRHSSYTLLLFFCPSLFPSLFPCVLPSICPTSIPSILLSFLVFYLPSISICLLAIVLFVFLCFLP